MKTLIIAAAFLLITGTAGGEIYKCTDAGGNVTFAAKPGPGCKLLPGSAPEEKQYDGKKWYEGGDLHRATVGQWRQASYRNRLATSADWFVNITKSHNPVLQKELKRLSLDEYLSALKTAATQLEACISGRVSKMKYPNIKAATIATFCYKSFYSIK